MDDLRFFICGTVVEFIVVPSDDGFLGYLSEDSVALEVTSCKPAVRPEVVCVVPVGRPVNCRVFIKGDDGADLAPDKSRWVLRGE